MTTFSEPRHPTDDPKAAISRLRPKAVLKLLATNARYEPSAHSRPSTGLGETILRRNLAVLGSFGDEKIC